MWYTIKEKSRKEKQMPQNIKWKSKLKEVESLLKEGKTLKEVGEVYGVSRERIRQVIAMYLPTLYKDELWGIAVLSKKKKEDRLREIKERWGRDSWFCSDLEAAQAAAFQRKRQNAKQLKKWEWELERKDIDWPKNCPILGIELDYFADSRSENSPSFDRIDSTRGYVKGNVIIVSWRANRIKNDGTSEEHEKIASFLKKRGI